MSRTRTVMLSIAAIVAAQLLIPATGAEAAEADVSRALSPVRELPKQLRYVDPTSSTGWVDGGRGIITSGADQTSMRVATSRGKAVRSSASETVVVESSTSTDSVIQRTSDGGRIIEVLHSNEAPSEFVYELDVPRGQQLSQLPDGSILIGVEERSGDDVTFSVSGVLSRAWAQDASGNSLPVRYTVDDSRVTMHVDHSTVPESSYPLVADPTLSGGGWQASWSILNPASVTIKANKKRTAQIAGDEGNIACAFLAVIPTVGAVASAICLLDVYLMKKAYRAGYCVGDRINIITRHGTALIYKGGFCT